MSDLIDPASKLPPNALGLLFQESRAWIFDCIRRAGDIGEDRGRRNAIKQFAAEIQHLRTELASHAFRPIDDTARNGEWWLLCNRWTGKRVVAQFEAYYDEFPWAENRRYQRLPIDWPTHYAALPPLPEGE